MLLHTTLKMRCAERWCREKPPSAIPILLSLNALFRFIQQPKNKTSPPILPQAGVEILFSLKVLYET